MKQSCFYRTIIGLIGVIFITQTQAAIQIPATGVTYDFAVAPSGITEWCTLDTGGDATLLTDTNLLDAYAQTIDAESTNNVAMLQPGGIAAQRVSFWDGGTLYTRPTTVQANVLIAKLQNTSGSIQTALQVQFDASFTLTSGIVEEIPGWGIYYSTNGTPGSWIKVGQFSVSGQVSFTLGLGAWANNAPLYLMWLDDNGSGTPDWLQGLDNLNLSFPSAPTWIAYNDHNGGAGTAPNATTYSMTASSGAGGPLRDFATGQSLPVSVDILGADGIINGDTGSSTAPDPGTPAYNLFGDKITFDSSAIYFSPAPYSATVTFTFSNLTPGRRYNFRGTAVRGNNYSGRWSLVTLAGVNSAVPAHLTGPGSPGVVTNGWAPYGDSLMPGLQAAYNSGENRCGDVIGWDNIVPSGTSFSIICSNYHVLLPSGAAVPGGVIEDTYCYAFNAFSLEEVSAADSPVIISPMVPQTNAPGGNVAFTVGVAGVQPLLYYWFTNNVLVLTNTTASFTSGPLIAGSNFLCTVIVSNTFGTATSSAAAWGVVPTPSIQLGSPAPGQMFNVPATVVLQATVNGGLGGSVTGVGYYSTNSGLLASAISSPFSAAVVLPVTNTYGIYAIVTNDYGVIAYSPTNVITVLSNVINLTGGLVGHWGMNDGTGMVASDASGYNHQGALRNGPTWTTGRLNGGLRLDGADDFVDIINSPALNPTSAITLATWFNSANLSAGGMVISKGASGAQYHLRIFAGSVRFRLEAGGILTGDEPAYPFANNTWYHVAAVYDGSRLRIYVNGALINTPMAVSGAIGTSGVNLALGVRSAGNNNYFNGTLDDVRIYNRALTSNEIAALAVQPDDRSWDFGDAPEPPYATSLVANGPRHAVGALFLGARIDPEANGQPTASATGDDSAGVGDDEDGVVFPTAINPGYADNDVEITVSRSGRLDAWMDFNTNGVWTDAGEHILINLPVKAGINNLTYSVPSQAPLGNTFARFRLSSAGGLAPTGSADDGEVEDYQVTINAPVPNVTAPAIAQVVPAPGSTLGGLTDLQVAFTEPVVNVDASDLLINGIAAVSVSGSGSNYNFTVAKPGLGLANIAWAPGHGIVDRGRPPLPFSATATNSTWSYTIVDLAPPTVAITTPANNTTFTAPATVNLLASASDSDGSVTNVEFYASGSFIGRASGPQFSLTWSNVPAASYALTAVAQDSAGWRATSAPVNINVVVPTGVALGSPNTFDTVPPATHWSTMAIPGGGANYLDASQLDAAVNTVAATSINQALGTDTAYNTRATAGWNATEQTVYLRITGQAASLLMATLINSTAGTLTTLNVSYTASNSFVANEEINGPRAYYSMSGAPGSWIVIPEFSTNAIGTLTATLDLGAWPSGSLMYILWADDNGNGMTDTALIFDDFLAEVPGPTVRLTGPANNSLLVLPDVFPLTATVASFSNAVTNVTFTANGNVLGFVTNQPYSLVWTNATSGNYQLRASATDVTGFSVTSGPVNVRVQNNVSPAVALVGLPNGAAYTAPSDITITVSASDTDGVVTNVAVFANGSLIVQQSVPSFGFVWPSVPIGIYDLTAVARDNLGYATTSSVARIFVLASSAPTVESFVPASGTLSSLSQITVNFSEPVDGVKAADLLVNGRPATAVQGANATYTFTFPAQPEGISILTWAGDLNIVDRESPPKRFDGAQTSASAQYRVVDTLAPSIVEISPTSGATVPVLSKVEITFSEAVAGVNAADLLINGNPAAKVSGAHAGPYVFELASPVSGLAQVSWATNHGIRDLAQSQNAFTGIAWNYTVDVAAAETNVVINEIMYHPASENSAAEYIELHNRGGQAIRLLGWRITGGVNFDFPDVTLPSGGYLVIAANLAVFNATYPGVTNAVGDWSGKLSNRDDRLRLRNALGNVINEVHYATEGDWALRQRGPYDAGAYGWEWYAPHDGRAVNTATGATESNKTLELMNPAMANDNGQNWVASSASGGSPGRINSFATNDIAPLIYDVRHSPEIPNATQAVTITARIVDEAGAPTAAALYYRDVTTTALPAFAATNLFDDGQHNDGSSNDGLYGAILPALPLGTVIEFYVSASDAAGRNRTWPAAVRQSDGSFAQTANAHYQVDEDSNNAFGMPYYRLVLTGAEANELLTINSGSDAEMNCTFISRDGTGIKVRYNSSVRIRGAGSRGRPTKNWRVNIPTDRKWNDLTEINLNSQVIHAQLVGSLFSLKSGLPAAATRVVQVRLNGVNRAPSAPPPQGNGDWAGFGSYILVEPINGEWAANHFPEDSGGNTYRGSIYPWTANLDYLGTNVQSYLNAGYAKTSNQSENDWTDLINLTYALSANPPDVSYPQLVRQNVNVPLFMRYFALGTIISYYETSMFRGVGDDYAMYRGVNDPRFLLVPHDFDTILGQGDSSAPANWSIWQFITQPATTSGGQYARFLNRFMTHPEFASLYYAELKRLNDTTFTPVEMNALIDQALGGWVPAGTIANMKTYVSNRNNYVRSQIPLGLTVATGLSTQNGYLYTTSPTVTLTGRSHAIDTRSVKVGDGVATWSGFNAAWTNTVTLMPGINRLTVRALNASQVDFDSAIVEIWYDTVGQTVSGTIGADTTWSAASGPYNVNGNIIVGTGATLTIQPGTTLYLASGVNIIVANGGRLLAEGTAAAPIRFTRAPSASTTWGGMMINGAVGSPETRITYAHFENNNNTAIDVNAGTVFLDHLTFGNPARRYLDLDGASFVVQNCVFPATTAAIEPLHGTLGVRSDGRGIFRRNFVGRVTGYNDAFDFTGGNRPAPILQVINNVFMGSDDDLLDLDGTDAWIEGNIFLNTHRTAASPDSSSAVSGGNDSGQTSEITVVGNLIYNVDQAALAKQGNFYTMLHNTIVKQNGVGSADAETAVVILADENTAQGAGIYLEGNLIHEAEKLVRHQTNAVVTYTNNLISALAGAAWSGPGGGNFSAEPKFKYVPAIAEVTGFTNWTQAQVMWDWLSLQAGSPAVGRGAGGRDLGAVNALGAYVAGVPEGVITSSNANLTVGFNVTGNGMQGTFPNGSGYTHYKWRLDGGAWSAETSVGTPINLSGLSFGPHYVEVVGKNDAGWYQDDALLAEDARVTRTRTWIVNPTAITVRINEVLARNDSAQPVNGRYPDLIELYNHGAQPVNLSGMSLSDSAGNPQKYVFPPGAVLAPGAYLVVYADNESLPAGYHTGFTLKQEGDDLYLYAATGALLDSVVFGPQLADRSVGRLADGSWNLCLPTFGSANQAAPLGNPYALKINEWLAGTTGSDIDFIELFNPGAAPVALGNLYLTDTPQSLQDLHQIAALSFIPASGYAVFLADGSPELGPEHLAFQLTAEQGLIGLFDVNRAPIDLVTYGPQTNGISFGRSPNGSTNLAALVLTTPAGPNPSVTAQYGTQLVINEVMAKNINAVTNSVGASPEWIELHNPTASAVALNGMSLSDDPALPGKFVFPAGLVLAAGQYLVIWCDDGAPASTNNTGFAISANGGAVYLYDGQTNAGPIDYIFYGVQAKDFSIGRSVGGGTNWLLNIPTAGGPNIPAALGNAANLKINEWMADPASGADWFELYNPDPQPVALDGLWLTDDTRTPASRMRFQIPPLSFIGTGLYGYERFWADNSAVAEPSHCNFALRAAGEWLGVSWPDGTLINGVQFGPQFAGVSEGRLPDGADNLALFDQTATPADANYLPLTDLAINEVLSAWPPGSNLEGAIELRNLSAAPVDVTGWYLSNARRALQKFAIPATIVTNPGPTYVTNRTIIPAGGYLVIYENQFNSNPDEPTSFALNPIRGDEVYLASTDIGGNLTGYRAAVTFGAAEPGVSFGRHVNSAGQVDFVAMSARTLGVDVPDSLPEFRQGAGLPNAYPQIGPVVFSEIMYHPTNFAGGVDNVRDEYVELFNASSNAVPLFDPANPTNTWRLRGGVDFDFPTNVILPSNGYLLVVSFDPVNDPVSLANFRAAYPQLPVGAVLHGPYQGKLSNSGEDVELKKPGAPVPAGQADGGFVPYIMVEQVNYSQALPWDSQADGSGLSLRRLSAELYGNEPTNWQAGAPTPGRGLETLPDADSDGDGIPDWWTMEFFGHNQGLVSDQSQAGDDPDGDGLANLQEFYAGTHPLNAASVLQVLSIAPPTTGVTNAPVTFLAISNRTYTVEFKTALDATPWSTLQSIPAADTNRLLQIPLPAGGTSGFLRLRTP